jgi:gliding motility-associated-like protein
MVQRISKWGIALKESDFFHVRYFIALTVIVFFSSTSYAGWVAGYTYKSKLVISGSQVCGSTSHTNFPALIQITADFLKPSPAGLISNSNGYDIIFTSNDGNTILNHEIDNYNSTTGSYSAWVQISTLTPGVDTEIYMYYGNNSVSVNPSTQNTWNTNYRTVYHFQNNNFTDGTINGINGTNSGSSNVTARFGEGRNFDGTDDFIQTTSNDLATANNFTISVWVKADATVPSHIIWEGKSGQNGWGDSGGGEQELNLSTGTCCPSGSAQNNYLSFFLGDRDQQTNTGVLTAETTFNNTTSWQYVVATITDLNSSPTARLYLNGSLVSTDVGVVGSFTDRNLWDTNLRIGRPGSSSRFFDGQLDEIRISNVVRTSDWICTEYNNQDSPNTFATLINHAPELDNIEVSALAFTEDGAATSLTSAITASDWDNANVVSAIIKITSNYVNGEDVLLFSNTGSITGTWISATGTLNLAGTDTYANYQLALRAIKYQNLNTGNPSSATRTISFTINDGSDNSNTVSRNVTITSVNDSPVAVDDGVITSQNVPYTGNIITNDTDVEGNSLTLNTTVIIAPIYGSVTMNANGSITYTPKINFVGTDSFTYEVCDNGSPSACDQGTVTITVNGATPPSGCSGNNPTGGSSTSGLYAEYYSGYFNDNQSYFTSNAPTFIRSTDGPFNYSNDFGGVSAPINGTNPTLFSARYRGSVYIPTTGSYTFYLTSDDAAYLWIDQDALVSPPVTASALINNSGLHSAVLKQATIYLAEGLHNFLIHFGNNNGLGVLKLQYSGPGITTTVIPASAFCTSVQKTVAANDTYTTGINVTLNGTTVLANDYNQDGNSLSVNTTPVSLPTNGSVTLNADGTFTYIPSANFVGTDNFVYQVCSSGMPSICSQAVVFINVANKVPSFTKGSNQSVNEDAGIQTVSGWATAIDDGDPGVSQTLTFNVSNNNNALFSTQPAINANGDLTYQATTNTNGVATVTVTLSDNGSNTSPSVNTSTSQIFIITINAVNDIPSFTKGGDQSINEDDGVQTILNWATALNDGDTELSQTLNFNVSNDNNSLFNVQPSINAGGDLTYTPAANANGVATVTVSISDNGLNVSPDVNTSATQTFTITINGVNDIPSFTKGGDQSVNEDAVPQTVPSWATAIDDGDPELTQALTFNVTNDNNSLFSAQPAVNAAGDLTYTPAVNANGLATVTITISDDGLNVSPNINKSTSQVFTISINAVNDAPTFTRGSNLVVNEDAVAQTVIKWAKSIDDGDPELSQTLTFNVSNNRNALFSVQPALNSNGDLTYTPAPNVNGFATVSITLSDNDSGISPNVNKSVLKTFRITIRAVNDIPSFTKGSSQVVNEDAGLQTASSWATAIDDGDSELAQVLSFNLSNDNNSLFSVQPAINASGDLTYTPSANANGQSTITVTIIDNGSGILPNINSSNAQTITITVNAVNDAPSFVKGADQSIDEDATMQTVSAWAGSIDDGDPELTQTVTFSVTNDNNALFSVQPSITGAGDLIYTAAANTNGIATVTISATDDGSGISPNVNTSTVESFTISITAINDIPSFVKGANQFVDEDAGTQTVSGWATMLDDGDIELTQALSFNVSNDNNLLFSTQPFINEGGELKYTSADNANGTTNITVTISDDGSDVLPNLNTSDAQTFTINVAPVNDPPAAEIDSYIVDEDGLLDFPTISILINDNDVEDDVLTAVLESTTSNGTLTLNADGSFKYKHDGSETTADSFTYHAFDGNLNGNTVTVNITVTPVNDPPIAQNNSVVTEEDTAVDIDVLSNDSDSDDGINSGSVVILSNATNGALSVNSISGVVTYTPDPAYNGSDTFTYVISDNTGVQSTSASVSIMVKPVNDPPTAVDDGPFKHETVVPITIDVLENDSDEDNDHSDLIITSVSSPSIGSTTIENNQIVFQPSGMESGEVIFTYVIQDTDGLTDEASVTIEYRYDPFKVSEGFSPNSDGNNDTWYIRNIEAYPNNILRVFDRWGILVYQIQKYDNASVVWDGRANTGMQSGDLVDSGTYYYFLSLGDNSAALKGYVEIVR